MGKRKVGGCWDWDERREWRLLLGKLYEREINEKRTKRANLAKDSNFHFSNMSSKCCIS